MPRLETQAEESALAALEAELTANAKAPTAATPALLASISARLRLIPFSEEPARRVRCLTEIARQYWHHGQEVFAAVEPIALAVMLARDIDDRPLLRRALSIQGLVLTATNNSTDALRGLLEALDIAHELGDVLPVLATWNNIGNAFAEAALFEEAKVSFERAAEISLQLGDDPVARGQRAMALANAAAACLQLADYAAGIPFIAGAVALMDNPQTSEDFAALVLAETTYTRLLVALGRRDEAQQRATIARAASEKARSLRADIAAASAAAFVEVLNGQHDVGISRIIAALERSRVLQSSLRETLNAAVQVYEISNRPDRARSMHRELMMLLRKSQQALIMKNQELHLERLNLPAGGSAVGGHEVKDQELTARLIEAARGPSPQQYLEALAMRVELREERSGEHAFRVGKWAALLAKAYGLDDAQSTAIELAARLHDVGKVIIPDSVIRKRNILSSAEREIINTHALEGAELLARSGISYRDLAGEIARYHHERWSGDGYPDGISGSAIPLSARMVALADAFDSMVHDRPYRAAMGMEEALQEIARYSGKEFDPNLTELFIRIVRVAYSAHEDIDAFLAEAARSAPFAATMRRLGQELERPPVAVTFHAQPGQPPQARLVSSARSLPNTKQ